MKSEPAKQTGGILAMVLLAWVVLAGLAFATVVTVTRETQMRSSSVRSWQALYLAEAAIQRAIAELAQDPDHDWSNNPPHAELDGKLGTGTYAAVLTPVRKDRAVVVATGRAKDKIWSVKAVLAVDWQEATPEVEIQDWREPESLRHAGL